MNDARYAAARAENLAARGFGDTAVRYELERDGVAQAEIDAALAELPPERERALDVLRRAKSPLAGVRRLAAKGFSAESVEAAAAEARIES